MRILGSSKAWLAVAQYALFVCITQSTGVVFGSAIKLLAALIFVFLLFFVVGRAPQLLRIIVFCLRKSSDALVAPSTALRRERRFDTSRFLPDDPLASLHFQRPPPLYPL